jgi:hypothetical protein
MSEFCLEAITGAKSSAFARCVKLASHSELKTVMVGEQRDQILDLIFGMFPSLFRPNRAGVMNCVIKWKITGRADGEADLYQLAVVDRVCTSIRLPDPEGRELTPQIVISMDAVDFLQLMAGTTSPSSMFMMGKIKTKGDSSLATSFVSMFDMPRC